jgi:small ligand-binding sensory domain FIST
MPIRQFRSAFAHGDNAQSAVRSCHEQLDGLIKGPALGVLYLSRGFESEIDSILKDLKSATGIEHWVGASTDAVIAGGRLMRGDGIAILALPLLASEFKLFDGMPDIDSDHVHGLVHSTIEQDKRSGLERMLLACSTRFCGGQVEDGIHIADAVMAGSMSGVAFASRVVIEPVINRALRPTGPVHELTALYGDLIAGIEGRDPTLALADDVGDILMRNPVNLKNHILAELTLQDADGQTGRSEFAAIHDVDQIAQKILLDRPIRASHIRFLRRDPIGGLADLRDNLREGAKRLGEVGAALYFMSSRRGENLFGAGSDELSALRECVGNVPIIGMMTDREVFASHDEFCSSVAMLIAEIED